MKFESGKKLYPSLVFGVVFCMFHVFILFIYKK